MSAVPWPRVKALFQAAVERPAADRAAFLAVETGDDDALRREVESLLASDTSDITFLDQLPVATDVEWLRPTEGDGKDVPKTQAFGAIEERTVAGRRFGSYSILELLG